MAKQIGIFKIIGTIGDITFYEMDGEFYARKKSSLDRKRVRKDPRFRRTMEEAIGFGKASAATLEVYWALPAEQRGHGVYGRLTWRMRKLMREGKDAEQAKLELMKEFGSASEKSMQKTNQKNLQKSDFTKQLLKQVFAADGDDCKESIPPNKSIHVSVSEEMHKRLLSDIPVFI